MTTSELQNQLKREEKDESRYGNVKCDRVVDSAEINEYGGQERVGICYTEMDRRVA